MLEGKRRVNKKKILHISHIDISPLEASPLIVAELKKQKELLERDNREASKSLDSKRRSLNLDYKSCEKIEKEHFAKIDKARNEYLDIVDKFDIKNGELININNQVSSLIMLRQDLLSVIPELKQDKIKLEKEIYETIERYNNDKKNSEIYLNRVREKIEESNKEFNVLDEKLTVAKAELKEITEKNTLENKILARRHNDLEIYERRIRKQNPNINLT
jgi:chromosome segregation ATPase